MRGAEGDSGLRGLWMMKLEGVSLVLEPTIDRSRCACLKTC